MTDRERLIEIMARAIAAENNATLIFECYIADALAAIAAAEREGFRWVAPEDGR